MNERELLIALVSGGLSFVQYNRLLEAYGTLVDAASDEYKLFPKLQDKFNKKGIVPIGDFQCLSILDPHYPAKLHALDKPPLVLWYEGELRALDTPSLGVVGSRQMSKHTLKILDNMLPPLMAQGVAIISGLAFGVDKYAHELAVKNSRVTIGVLGGGLDDETFYPKSNLSLKTQIIDRKGLILSEYPPGFKPTKYSFPQRNRIIAALSDQMLVAQAAIKSGSLITAECAKKMRKTVLTPTVDYFEASVAGNRLLIEQGSPVLTDSHSLLSHFHIEANVSESKVRYLTLDELIAYFKLTDNIAGEITKLELLGQVEQSDGGTYKVLE